MEEEFEDTKGVIRSRKSKDRQYNGQNKKAKLTNNDLPRCSCRVNSSCSTSNTCRVALVEVWWSGMELFHEAWFFFDVTLNAVGYKNTILATEAVNFMHKNGHGFLFQQDHACPHTASMSMAFCKQLAIDVMPWLSYQWTSSNTSGI